jgi:hypothetical protein
VTAFDYGVDYYDDDGASIFSAKSFTTQRSRISLNQPSRNTHFSPMGDDMETTPPSVHGTLLPRPKPNFSTTTASEILRTQRLSTLPYEDALCRSGVYKRCVLNLETSSFKSLRTASSNWSQLSDISLSAVSSVSIILLPILWADVEDTIFSDFFDKEIWSSVTGLRVSTKSTPARRPPFVQAPSRWSYDYEGPAVSRPMPPLRTKRTLTPQFALTALVKLRLRKPKNETILDRPYRPGTASRDPEWRSKKALRDPRLERQF